MSQQPDTKRRAFLRGSVLLGAGATLTTGTAALASPETEEETAEQSEQPAKQAEQKGYRLTRHIEAYYRNAAS